MNKVYEPEVLPPETDEERAQRERGEHGRARQGEPRLGAGGKLLFGLAADLVDFVLRGPAGLKLGLPVGLALGIWLGRRLGLRLSASLGLGLLVGVYCALPGTSMIPLGTILAALTGVSFRPR